MEPGEVIDRLKKTGINISRSTLSNWENWGLIPKAEFRNSRKTIYPGNTWAEGFASDRLRKAGLRVNKDRARAARERALRVKENPRLCDPRNSRDYFIDCLAVNWLLDKARAEADFLNTDVEFVLDNTSGKWKEAVKPAGEGKLIIKFAKGDREDYITLSRLE